MKDSNCLFCRIVAGEEASEKVWENEEFVCIKNKYPVAPVHVLVMPKEHVSKKDWISPTSPRLRGAEQGAEQGRLLTLFWGKMMAVVFAVVTELGLDKSGYKLVNNGAGYNHFEHEHMHILGGTKTEPGGAT